MKPFVFCQILHVFKKRLLIEINKYIDQERPTQIYADLTHQIWRFLVYIFLCPWDLGALFYLNSNIFIFNMLRFRPHIFLFSLILFKNILKYTYFFSPPVLWYTTKTQTLFVNVKLNTFYLNSLYLGRPWSRPLNSVRKSSE